MKRFLPIALAWAVAVPAAAQSRSSLPDVSSTVKGELLLPVPLGNPIFASVVETVGQLGAVFQAPIKNGLGIGAGANMTWFTLKERALAPYVDAGDVRRLAAFGQAQYERYLSDRTFVQAGLRLGTAYVDFDCPTCAGQRPWSFYWGLQSGLFMHASDNLAFGLLMGYDNLASRFVSDDLGLTEFPGRRENMESRPYQNLSFGLGFSTRLRRSEREPITW
jgi:hypothetical protein